MSSRESEKLVKKLRLNDVGFTFFNLSVFLGSLPVAMYVCTVLSVVFIALYYLFAATAFLVMIVFTCGLIFTTENPTAIFTWIDGQSVLEVVKKVLPYSAYAAFLGAISAAVCLTCYACGSKGGRPIFKMVWCVIEFVGLIVLGVITVKNGGVL